MSVLNQAAAFEHHGAPVTRQRFYEIACDPARSVAVEACAGAGKTWMLVSRMLRALLLGCAPHDILAITFTKKAAGEMRQRLHAWLAEFAHANDATLRRELLVRGLRSEPTPEQLSTLRQLHFRVLHSGRPVQIRTFHSWFAALLRSAPLGVLHALGLPTVYELLENDAQAVAQVWRRFLGRIAQDVLAREDFMAAVAAYGRHQTMKALEAAVYKRVEFALADAQGVVDASVQPFAAQFPDFAGLAVPLDRLAQPEVQQLLQDCARALGASSQAVPSKAASALEQALTAGDMDAVFVALLTQKGEPRKFSDKLAGIDTVRQAQALLQRVQQAQTQHAAWLHQQRMARLTRGLLDDFAALKRERGWIDMGDLERTALTLMRDPVLSGWVQERLDARVRHVLIDEFQDTNPLQWQALQAWLTSYAGAAQAPSVFIVGDPKQSIYRFRRAEPQVFQAAQSFVVQTLAGDVLSCDHTRRNAPPVIALVNRLMGQAQADAELDGFRPHSTESTAPGYVYQLPRILRGTTSSPKDGEENGDGDATAAAQWRDSLTTPRTLAEETRKTLECRQAARWLAQQLQVSGAGLRPCDIMVLARKRERLALIQVELAALHIPAQQPEKTELGDMPEVQDVVALLDALVSPRHDLALARALKSPLFGVADADLVQLALRARGVSGAAPVPWLQVLQSATDLPVALVPLGSRLSRWQHWLRTLPPHDALSAIYQDGDVLACYAATTPPGQCEGVLANLQALLMAALQLDGGRYVTAYALVRALKAGGLAAPLRADAQAVRLLTVHGAKGLEAPLVLLLDTDGEAQKPDSMGLLIQWPGESAWPLRLVFLASESKPPDCVREALEQEQRARRREELNGLYVAVTRAQHGLVLSSTQPYASNPASWWQRLQPWAEDAPWPPVSAPVPLGLGQAVLSQHLGYSLNVLPSLGELYQSNTASARMEYAQSTTNSVANVEDSLESRIGQAMHRLLEWVDFTAQARRDTAPWSAWQRAAIGREFALDLAQADAASQMALGILQGQAAWAWDPAQIRWQANEVLLHQRGRTLRLDRLVQHRSSAAWWVLDYKSAAHPEQDAALCQQLANYRAAVAQIYPGQVVRAAFLTPQGRCVELPESASLSLNQIDFG